MFNDKPVRAGGEEIALFQAMMMEQYEDGASPSLVMSRMLDAVVPPGSSYVEVVDELVTLGDVKTLGAMAVSFMSQARTLAAFCSWAERIRCRDCNKKRPGVTSDTRHRKGN